MAEFSCESVGVQTVDPICIINKSESAFEVGTGLVFKQDGIYTVIVKENRITVTKEV